MRYRYYNATVALIVVNVVMFLLMYFVRGVSGYLALTPALVVENHAWWQPVSYMFLHGGTWHLLFYFVTGIGAELCALAVNWYSGMAYIPVVGASGGYLERSYSSPPGRLLKTIHYDDRQAATRSSFNLFSTLSYCLSFLSYNRRSIYRYCSPLSRILLIIPHSLRIKATRARPVPRFSLSS